MFHLYDFKFKYFDPCTDQMILFDIRNTWRSVLFEVL